MKAHAFGEASDSELDQASLEADLLSREYHDLKIVMSRPGQSSSSAADSGHGARAHLGTSAQKASTSRGGGHGSPIASLGGGRLRPSSPSVAVSLTSEDVCVAVTSREGDAELDAAISALSGPSSKWEHAAKLVRDICIGSASAKVSPTADRRTRHNGHSSNRQKTLLQSCRPQIPRLTTFFNMFLN